MSVRSRRQTLSTIDVLNSTNNASTPKPGRQSRNNRYSVCSSDDLRKEVALLSMATKKNLSTSLNSDGDLDKSNKSDQNNAYSVHDLVWAKVQGFPYWPGKISKDPISTNSEDIQTNKPKTKPKTKTNKNSVEYYVEFFGSASKFSYVAKEFIRAYDCHKTRTEALKKAKKNPNLQLSIDEADKESQRLVIVDSNSVKINGVSASTSTNISLLSVEDELKMIKDFKEEKTDVKIVLNSIEINNSVESPSSNARRPRNSILKAEANVLKSKNNIIKTPTPLQQQKSKINKLKGEELDQNISSAKKTYDLLKIKCEDFTQKYNKKKRSRSADPKSELFTANIQQQVTQSRENKTTKRRKFSIKLEEDVKLPSIFEGLKAESSSPYLPEIDLKSDQIENVEMTTNKSAQIEDLVFKSVTIVIDSSNEITEMISINKLTYYLIEKLHEYYSRSQTEDQLLVTIYDISKKRRKSLDETKDSSNTLSNGEIQAQDDDEDRFELISHTKSPISNSSITIEKKIKNKKKILENYLSINCSKLKLISLNFVNNLIDSVKNDLILSLISTDEDLTVEKESFEQKILEIDNINDLKYISFMPFSNLSALYLHRHFKHNKAQFIEAPLLFTPFKENGLKASTKLYASTYNAAFYISCINLFSLFVEKNNLIFKGSHPGLPSNCVNMYNSINIEILLENVEENLKTELNMTKIKDKKEKLQIRGFIFCIELKKIQNSRIDSTINDWIPDSDVMDLDDFRKQKSSADY